jgi:hypothetical protein
VTTEALAALVETPDAFAAWLDWQDRNADVGITRDARACPIARWLTVMSARGDTHYTCGAGEDALVVGETWVPCPKWARIVMLLIDSHGRNATPVTAARAIDVLWLVETQYT